ncbi:hypothetical protein CTI12_AA011580 [Artemisia annua]|uniref:Uncharacterized protein n=1 Tax=Artemisia annua TaxID=35608 RepID=A0A2U1QLF9_ARTAN|nr:hypothetical protein CTI12_AA011580 [Artemisia annua]
MPHPSSCSLIPISPLSPVGHIMGRYGSYDYVLTFTLASSRTQCANNSTTVNVSGPSVSKVFFFRESHCNETWQTHAYSLGINDFQRSFMKYKSEVLSTVVVPIASFSTASQLTPTPKPLLDNPLHQTPSLPIKKLTPADMQKRRAKGLCYNCPKKYHPGHQCNPPKFLLLQSDHEHKPTTIDPPWGISTVEYYDNAGP